jgi:histidinol-phosphate phosphatase family protein
MKAIILAGGKGTRLGDLTKDVPKPMVLVADKPVLHHQVDLLKKYGITDILFIVNHLKDSIVDYFGDGKKWGVKISYFLEKEPLGTSGALKEIENDLKEEFLLLYGDVMINMNLKRLIDFHHRKKSDCTLVLHPNDHPYDSDLVEIDKEGRVNAFHSKPHDPDRYYRNMVNAGLYLLHPKVLKLYGPGKQDFGKDIFPEIFSQLNMYGYNTSEYLKDMGTPDRLKKVTADYLSQKIEKSNYDYPQKAIFLDRDGVINDDKDLIHKVEDFELYPFSAEAIKKINQSDYLGIVVTNQSVVARNLCTEEGLDAIHKKMDTELGKERVWLDALYYCPHQISRRKPGIQNNLRLQETGAGDGAQSEQ